MESDDVEGSSKSDVLFLKDFHFISKSAEAVK